MCASCHYPDKPQHSAHFASSRVRFASFENKSKSLLKHSGPGSIGRGPTGLGLEFSVTNGVLNKQGVAFGFLIAPMPHFISLSSSPLYKAVEKTSTESESSAQAQLGWQPIQCHERAPKRLQVSGDNLPLVDSCTARESCARCRGVRGTGAASITGFHAAYGNCVLCRCAARQQERGLERHHQ